MRRLVLAFVAMSLGLAGCSNDEFLRSPSVDEELQILASALEEACEVERRCSTVRPIKLIQQSPRAEELRERLTDYEIETVSAVESRALEMDDESGRIKDGATIVRMFGPKEVRPGVLTVEVQTTAGSVNEYRAGTFVYQLQDAGWVRVSPEAVGLTVTSTVS